MDITTAEGFEWDKYNANKILSKHSVATEECEEIFKDAHAIFTKDELHSKKEERYRLIGTTKAKRYLAIVFTIRGQYIRVITARPADKKERSLYEQEIKGNT